MYEHCMWLHIFEFEFEFQHVFEINMKMIKWKAIQNLVKISIKWMYHWNLNRLLMMIKVAIDSN